jgi:chitinase
LCLPQDKVFTALQSIQKNHPDVALALTLPVMPEGFPSEEQAVVKAAAAKGVNFQVNIMAMDYGVNSRKGGSDRVRVITSGG